MRDLILYVGKGKEHQEKGCFIFLKKPEWENECPDSENQIDIKHIVVDSESDALAS